MEEYISFSKSQGMVLGAIGGSVVGLATIIGSLPLFSKYQFIEKFIKKIQFDFFLGLMLTATFLGLVIPAFKENNTHYSHSSIILALLSGIFFVFLAKIIFNYYLKKKSHQKSSTEVRAVLFVMAIIVQNIPEGLAAGASMTMSHFVNAISLLGVIALQDLTEGVTTGLSLFSLGLSKKEAFIGVALTGIIEAVFVVVGGHLSVSVLGVMPLIMAFAGGAMIFVTGNEIYEKTQNGNLKFIFNTQFVSGVFVMFFLNQI